MDQVEQFRCSGSPVLMGLEPPYDVEKLREQAVLSRDTRMLSVHLILAYKSQMLGRDEKRASRFALLSAARRKGGGQH